MDDDLRAAVAAQAEAHARRDDARFASYMAPGALVELGRALAQARGIRPRRYRIIDITVDSGAATSEVRYSGGGAYTLRQRWERAEAGWRAVSAECVAGSISRPWWRRLPFVGREEAPPERKELA